MTTAEFTASSGRKGDTLAPSLSIVLPVYNAEATLADQVCQLLEMLPDLSAKFEVLVVDDGSTDHTSDLARELERQFPQLRVLRHPRRRGLTAAVQSGLQNTTGEFVLVQDEHEPLSPRDLRRLWAMRGDKDLVVARTEPQMKPVDASLISRLMTWGRNVQQAQAERPLATGTQLIRRSAVEELAADPQSQHELQITRVHGAERIARATRRRQGGLISHIKDFALGE